MFKGVWASLKKALSVAATAIKTRYNKMMGRPLTTGATPTPGGLKRVENNFLDAVEDIMDFWSDEFLRQARYLTPVGDRTSRIGDRTSRIDPTPLHRAWRVKLRKSGSSYSLLLYLKGESQQLKFKLAFYKREGRVVYSTGKIFKADDTSWDSPRFFRSYFSPFRPEHPFVKEIAVLGKTIAREAQKDVDRLVQEMIESSFRVSVSAMFTI